MSKLPMDTREMLASRRLDAGQAETTAELAAGGLLLLMGFVRGGLWGTLLKLGGTALLVRGAAKTERVQRAMCTLGERHPSGIGRSAERVESSIDIDRPRHEIYRAWRDLDNLPAFMRNLLSVREENATRSHWVAKGPAGTVVNFDAEIINDIPGKLIAWQTVGNSSVRHSGSVHFEELADGLTRVRVVLRYDPPAHRLGAAVAHLLGDDPQREIDEDLHRFKQIMETGRVPSSNDAELL